MLKNVSDLIPHGLLCSLRDEWSDRDKFYFQKSLLPLMFGTLSEFPTKALNIFRPRLLLVGLTELEERG